MQLLEQGIEGKLEVSRFDAAGYAPVVDFGGWRVAILNYMDELEPECIDNFQQHSETDEVFLLLEGRCLLFIGEHDGKGGVANIHAVDMQLNQMYNMRKAVYHTHTLS